jgi:predicted P-loop ATPase
VQDIELIDVLHRIKGGYWQDEFIDYRSGKRPKESLTCFSPSALFSGGRRRENVVSLSGVLNIDIDAGHNEQHDLPGMRDVLYADKHVFAGHLSVSGKGLSLYIRINPEKHFETFLSLEKYFADTYGIVIDPSCKDVGRLRFVCYDEDLYLNEKAAKYAKTEKRESAEFQRRKVACCDSDVEYVLQQIERDRRDLTESYATWVKLGFSIHGEFGPNGEEFFHRISQFHPKYNRQECSRKYRKCAGGGVGIASFFWVAKEAGYEIVSPMTRELVRTAKYRKKEVGAGTLGDASARADAVQTAVDILGASSADAKRITDAVFDGATGAESDGPDETYDFLKKDIERKKFRRNVITGNVELNGDPLSDRLIASVMVEMRTKYGANKVKKEVVLELIETSAREYNPIRDLIEKNKVRDPKGCIDAVIGAISGAVDGLTEAQARDFRNYFIRKWLLGMVSGWYGTYSLLTLVFVGPQGAGKSKWFRGLFPDELRGYYAEAKMDGDKDHLILMATKALLLDDEFSGKSRKEAALFKELSSKQEITIRRPYARMSETLPRIAALAGTTNDESIKGDLTGNRRIIVIHTTKIDWELYESVDKTDLLVELYREWKRVGDEWMLNAEDIDLLNQATDKYSEVCAEEEMLLHYFEPPESTNPDRFMTNTQILNELTGKLNGASLRLSQNKLGQALKKHGYKRICKRTGRQHIWMYNAERKTIGGVGESLVETSPLPF